MAMSGAMQGTLVRYGPACELLAFISGTSPSPHRRHVILIAGLTDGMLSLAYAEPLSRALDAIGWTLVQAQLTSSYAGYGISSLNKDAMELRMLALMLKQQYGSTGIVLLGHSTGCQITVRYMQKRAATQAAAEAMTEVLLGESFLPPGLLASVDGEPPPVIGTVLQASVSDREYLASKHGESMDKLAVEAEAMVAAGDGESICCRLPVMGCAPVTANRLLALYRRYPLGDDDMFSSDLSDSELKAILQPVCCRSGPGHGHGSGRGSGSRSGPAPGHAPPCLVLFSGADQYVPAGVNIPALAARLATAIGPPATFQIVPGALHALNGREEEAAQIIAGFVEGLKY